MNYTKGIRQKSKEIRDLEESHERAERLDIPIQNELPDYDEMKSVFEDEDEEDGFDFGDNTSDDKAEDEVL